MAQHRFRAVIVLTLVVAGLAQAESKWVKLRSANFELYTSAAVAAGGPVGRPQPKNGIVSTLLNGNRRLSGEFPIPRYWRIAL